MAAGERIFVGLGSNLGDRLAQLRFGVEKMRVLAVSGEIVTSPIYESEPWGGVEQPPFLNAVVMFETALEPTSLFNELKWIEREAGRSEEGVRWGARELDLDLLLFGGRHFVSAELTIPHPYMTQRKFVLTPLCDLGPEIIIPGHYIKVEDALRALDDPCWIKSYNGGINL